MRNEQASSFSQNTCVCACVRSSGEIVCVVAATVLLQSTSTIHPSRPKHGTEIPIEEVRDKPIRQPASSSNDVIGPTKTSRDSPGSGRVGKRRVPMVDPVTEEMTEEEVDDNEAAVDKMKETVKETAAKVSEAAKGTIDQMKSAASSAMNKATDAVKEAASTAASAGSRALHDGVAPGNQGFMGATSTAQMNSSRLGSEDRKLATVEQLIVKDHAIIKLLYSEYTDAIDVQVKQSKVFALIHEMARHNAQEELVRDTRTIRHRRATICVGVAVASLSHHSPLIFFRPCVCRLCIRSCARMREFPTAPPLQSAPSLSTRFVGTSGCSASWIILSGWLHAQQRSVLHCFCLSCFIQQLNVDVKVSIRADATCRIVRD